MHSADYVKWRTCPLVLYGSNMCVGELPVPSQCFPLAWSEIFGGKFPQDRSDMLCLLSMILLKGKTRSHQIVRVTRHIFLESKLTHLKSLIFK